MAMNCPSCSSQVDDDSRFCGNCGTTVREASPDLTQTSLSGSGSRVTFGAGGIGKSTTSADSRFLPGAMVADRYRIVGLLGRGGMGEVFRADDIKLGQPVALKFLPEALQQDPGRLDRFMNEVRVARQVSHPNVCRVYDIGEVGGQHFLSMEFVDGEDLGSLLRRIGRLPQDKAVQLSRQICAGVAAAHARGVIHRDLKPANIMIDGEGQARITDFGLAGLADDFKGAEVRVGTPAYMSPEQLSGKEVTFRSDIYSLGLVLYELCTGKPTFSAPTLAELTRMQQETAPNSPASLVPDLEPGMEQVILRCLEKDPALRPESALAVSAALPGGDPLAAALAAGETPSPEMVAAAGPHSDLKPRTALICLLVGILGILASTAMRKSVSLIDQVPMERPPAALMDNAREMIRSIGYEESPVDRYHKFSLNGTAQQYMSDQDKSASRWEGLSDSGQNVLFYFYRQSPRVLVSGLPGGIITGRNPAPRAGDIFVSTDLTGRLLYFKAIPATADQPVEEAAAPDWSVLFEAAGLDIEAFEPAEAIRQPRVFSDTRIAWSGVLPQRSDRPVRVEAAALNGKAVFFELITEEDSYWTLEESEESDIQAAIQIFAKVFLGLLLAAVAFALYLALRNRRRGKGDVKGAWFLAITLAVLYLLYMALIAHHVASIAGEFVLILNALGIALVIGFGAWVLYMALEPYARRMWPQALVGWSRLLAGRIKDPVVGRDLLFGFAVAVLFMGIQQFSSMLPGLLGDPPQAPVTWGIQSLKGGRWAFGNLALVPLISLAAPMMHFVILIVLRLILRKPWLGNLGFVLFIVAANVLAAVAPAGTDASTALIAISCVLGAVVGSLLLALMTRLGLLAAAGNILFANLLASFPLTFDSTRPYFGTSLIGLAAMMILGILVYRIALTGNTQTGKSFLD